MFTNREQREETFGPDRSEADFLSVGVSQEVFAECNEDVASAVIFWLWIRFDILSRIDRIAWCLDI